MRNIYMEYVFIGTKCGFGQLWGIATLGKHFKKMMKYMLVHKNIKLNILQNENMFGKS